MDASCLKERQKMRKILLFSLAASLTIGCGYGASVCNIVDVSTEAARQACTVLRYMDSDGKVREVRVNAAELNNYGRSMARERDQDGGAQ